MYKYTYKHMAQDLKTKYKAKVLMLDFYKACLNDKYAPTTEEESVIASVQDRELTYNIYKTKSDLRLIHLMRAFIKGTPYSKVETKPKDVSLTDIVSACADFRFNYQVPDDYEVLQNAFMDWINTDKVFYLFEKPVRRP